MVQKKEIKLLVGTHRRTRTNINKLFMKIKKKIRKEKKEVMNMRKNKKKEKETKKKGRQFGENEIWPQITKVAQGRSLIQNNLDFLFGGWGGIILDLD